MRELLFSSRRRVIISSGLLVLLIAAAAAMAAWLVTGSATLRGSTSSIAAPTILPATHATTPLVPGSDGSLDVIVSNPNGAPLTVSHVDTSSVTVDDPTGACTKGNFSVNTSALIAGLTGFTIAANGTNAPLSIPGALHLNTNASTDCQNVDVTVRLGANAVTWTT